jgi:signal transduction histidine kinase
LNIYSKKQVWKISLLAGAVLIGLLSLWYTNKLVRKLSAEERKKVELWAKAMQQLQTDVDNLTFPFEVIQKNETVPLIETDEKGNILEVRNLDSLRRKDLQYLKEELEDMKQQHHDPIVISASGITRYIFYKDSILLTQLRYYPYIQLGVIFLFILVAYLAFSASRKAEQNQVWVGLSKETAHQLGTPISSLLAWLELLKIKKIDPELVTEIDTDIRRLETITERFSKIGSSPVLEKVGIAGVLANAINYIRSRSSNKIQFMLHFSEENEILVPVNISLFEWVIENLCKNAVDAMDGTGSIDIYIHDHVQVLYIDIKDTGKGVPKSKYRTIFNPGYTTKQRGWGLGLSLSKRIIEDYHNGKIFVKSSEINRGTTFRIALKK